MTEDEFNARVDARIGMIRARPPWMTMTIGMARSRINRLFAYLFAAYASRDVWWPAVEAHVLPLLPDDYRGAILTAIGLIPVLRGWYLRAKTVQSIAEKGAA